MNRRWVQHLSSVQNCHRKNSLAIDLSTIYGRTNRPNQEDMCKFVHINMGIKEEEFKDIQFHPFLPQVFVKLATEQALIRIEDRIKTGVKMTGKNVVLYGWRCDVPLTTVKLNGADPDTPKDTIVQVMSKYGKVETCDRGRLEYFKNNFVSDGTWLLRMRPEQGKGLPSIVYYTPKVGGNTDTWSVIFDGKISCCWKCGVEGHRGDQCRSARPKLSDQGQTAPVGIGTYCDVVKDGLAVQWQGMTNQQADFNHQMSLKPAKKAAPARTTAPARRPPPAVPAAPAFSSKWVPVAGRAGWENRVSGSCIDKRFDHVNLFEFLENEELEDEDIEIDSEENNVVDGKVNKRRNSNNQDNTKVVKSAKLDTEEFPDLPSKQSKGGQGEVVNSTAGGSGVAKSQVGNGGHQSQVGNVGAQSQLGNGELQSQVGSGGVQSQVGNEGDKPQAGGGGDQSQVGVGGVQSQLGMVWDKSQAGGGGDKTKVGKGGRIEEDICLDDEKSRQLEIQKTIQNRQY